MYRYFISFKTPCEFGNIVITRETPILTQADVRLLESEIAKDNDLTLMVTIDNIVDLLK